MKPRNFGRLLTAFITLAAAAFGSVSGLAASMWGGVFYIVPICTVVFGALGALIGGAIEAAILNRYPKE